MDHQYCLFIACLQELLMGGLFLLFRSKGIRSRRLLGIILLSCWILNTARLIVTPFSTESHFFAFGQINAGYSITVLLLLYFIEVIRPGWISWKNGTLVVLPYIAVVLIYVVVLRMTGEPQRELTGFSDFLTHIAEFNVWYRIIPVCLNILYLLVIHHILYHYRTYYDRWCARNYANAEQMDISWLRYMFWGLALVSLLYYLLLFNVGGPVYECHRVAFLIVFAFLIYKAMFQENPYPEKYFAQTLDEDKTETEHEDTAIVSSDDYFSVLLPGYVQQVEAWMQTTQPYLRKDFKLMDVNEIIPLNRTYLSRIFNEGMGDTFSQVVQGYRVEKAKSLLLQHPDISIESVANLSGFSAQTTFYFVFQKQVGMTPKQFRNQTNTDKIP